MSSNFYYEHIGHMQISILTLELYKAIIKLTDSQIAYPIETSCVVAQLKTLGYDERIIKSEIERFFYGFECLESYENNRQYLSLTSLGLNYLSEIRKAIKNQKNQFALIIRNSPRKNCVNVLVQESTFFDKKIYDLISEYKFRTGGARDFLKCMPMEDLFIFLNRVLSILSYDDTKNDKDASIDECISLVNDNGKYWSSVSSKYSWIFFKQRYDLDLLNETWTDYASVIEHLHHPVEWGGKAKDASLNELLEINSGIDLNSLLKNGILRTLYKDFKDIGYRLTAPGFLMWERRDRGFLLEMTITRLSNTVFTINTCSASDVVKYYTTTFDLKQDFIGDEKNTLNHLINEISIYKNRGKGLLDYE